jgi:hypothetical protein
VMASLGLRCIALPSSRRSTTYTWYAFGTAPTKLAQSFLVITSARATSSATIHADPTPEVVAFITIEEGDDLIVSFAIADEEPGEIVSLTLLRTPKYEFILPTEETGVSVSHESFPEEEERDRLHRIRVAPPVVTIETTSTRYELDVSKVDRGELRSAQRVLERMNFDESFVLELA